MKKLDIYLLHITYPDGNIRHYVGATKPGRFHDRLWEHRRAHGSRLTSHAARCGAEIEGWIIHTKAPAAAEFDYATEQEPAKLCPICSRLPAQRSLSELPPTSPLSRAEFGPLARRARPLGDRLDATAVPARHGFDAKVIAAVEGALARPEGEPE